MWHFMLSESLTSWQQEFAVGIYYRSLHSHLCASAILKIRFYVRFPSMIKSYSNLRQKYACLSRHQTVVREMPSFKKNLRKGTQFLRYNICRQRYRPVCISNSAL
jgi:hypothetical protein